MRPLEMELTALLEKIMETEQITNKQDMARLRQQCITVLDNIYNHFPAKEYDKPIPTTAFISNNTVTLEVLDHHSQAVYRREVELRYEENLNGLKLIGEDFDGNPSEIVFLSQAGILRIQDLTGKGSDQDLCGHH